MFKLKGTLELVYVLFLLWFTVPLSTGNEPKEQTTPEFILSTTDLLQYDKVDGEKEVKATDFPFVVFLYRRILYTHGFPICGGTIISETWVLTSASCLLGRTVAGQVIAGSANRNRYKRKDVRRIIKTIVHPNFDQVEDHSNIGLVKVRSNFTWSHYIKPVKLAKEDMTLVSKVPGNVIRWGKTKAGGVSTILTVETVSILVGGKCSNSSEMICSLKGKGGHCEEDSGYPLLIGKAIQVGIVSYDLQDCGEKDVMSKYTNVAYFRKWIKEISGV